MEGGTGRWLPELVITVEAKPTRAPIARNNIENRPPAAFDRTHFGFLRTCSSPRVSTPVDSDRGSLLRLVQLGSAWFSLVRAGSALARHQAAAAGTLAFAEIVACRVQSSK